MHIDFCAVMLFLTVTVTFTSELHLLLHQEYILLHIADCFFSHLKTNFNKNAIYNCTGFTGFPDEIVKHCDVIKARHNDNASRSTQLLLIRQLGHFKQNLHLHH